MCSLCLTAPCHDLCPNAEQSYGHIKCDGCHKSIYVGDDYFEVFDSRFCEKCIARSRTTLEKDNVGRTCVDMFDKDTLFCQGG